MSSPLVTIAVHSLNQGDFLHAALESIFAQNVSVEVFVLDAGSSDHSVEVIKSWAPQLAGWRSRKDAGQAAAINEGMRMGSAPYVCWLNSDDYYLAGGLMRLVNALDKSPGFPAAYGRVWNVDVHGNKIRPYWTVPLQPQASGQPLLHINLNFALNE